MEDRPSTTMDLGKYNNFILFLLLVMFSSSTANRGLERPSKQGVEVHKHSKHANNHIIKTFQDKHGDVIDCFDMYKQPSLTHPLLIDHQVQLKPQSTPRNMFNEKSMNTSSPPFFGFTKCPKGYIPIKRTSKEDATISMHLRKLRKTRLGDDPDNEEIYDAKVEYEDKLYGAKGSINVWSLDHFPDSQLSLASIWIAGGTEEKENDIVAGWIVYPELFKDKKTRLFIYWNVITTRKFGCFNLLCPGFVQISRKVHLGAPIFPTSVLEGKQYSIDIEIFQDRKTKHWWLRIRGENVGYWPHQLFPNLKDGTNYASWGGRVICPKYEFSAEMGSGDLPVVHHGPVFDFNGRVAYIRHIQVNVNGTFDEPFDLNQVADGDDKGCYDLDYRMYQDGYYNTHIYYGGPGNCTDYPP